MGVFSKIFSLFKTAKLTRPDRLGATGARDQRRMESEGRRTAAAMEARTATIDRRLGQARDQRGKLQEQKSARERQQLQDSPVYRFVYLGEGVDTLSSSNVAHIQYKIDESLLVVRFKDGAVYGYKPIFPQEAKSLFESRSKGTWVWDNLRVRGTRLGHRKDYFLLVEGHAGQRKWNRSEETAAAHGAEASLQSGQPDPFSGVGKYEKAWPKTNKGRRKKKRRR